MTGSRHDYHIHTRFSICSEERIEAACEAAIARGVDEIAITDHLDFGPEFPPGLPLAAEYLAAIDRCRRRYAGELVVLAGLEVGEPHLFPAEVSAALEEGVFDILLGSAHYARGMRAAWLEEYFEQPLGRAYESYFAQVVDLCAEGEFDILAHLDLVKRDARKFGRDYDGPEPYADMIRSALRSIVERGKGLELNTSPLRLGQPEPCPSLQILRWYRELGGEILTLGSDAHSSATVGAHVDLAVEMIKSVGFEYVTTFRRRQIGWMKI